MNIRNSSSPLGAFPSDYVAVTSALEYLKYHGISPSLLLLPDFVRKIGFVKHESVNDLEGAFVAHGDVGGCAASTAKALAMLQPKDSGRFAVHFITKSNAIGRALLDLYLRDEVAKCGCHPVDLSHFIPGLELDEVIVEERDGEPRVCLTSRYLPNSTQSFSFKDLETLPTRPLQLLESATIVGIMSLWGGLWQQIIHAHRTSEVDFQGLLFLNVDQLSSTVAKELSQVCHSGRLPEIVLSIHGHLARKLAFELDLGTVKKSNSSVALSIHNKLGLDILMPCPREVVLVVDGEAYSSDLDEQFVLHPLSLPSTLLDAAMILALAARRLLMQCSGSEKQQLSLRCCLSFAALAAQACAERGDYVTESDLVGYASRHLTDAYCHLSLDEWQAMARDGSSLWSRLWAIRELGKAFATTANRTIGQSLLKLLDEEDSHILSTAVSTLLTQPSDLSAVRSKTGVRRIVFVDLDLTLFDYAQARLNAARLALGHLFPSRLLDDALAIYQSVVNRWEAFELLGFPNLRQQWNCQDIYFIVKAMASPEFTLYKEEVLERLLLLESFTERAQLSMEIREEQMKAVEMFRCSEIGERLNSAIQRVKADTMTQLRARDAYLEFERQTTPLNPFPDAREFIRALTELGNVELYLVSEGDANVQWDKIEKLGLADLLSPTQVIVTDSIASPWSICHMIEGAIAARMQVLGWGPKEITNSQRSLSTDTRSLGFEIEALEYYLGLFDRFKHKADGNFFARALHLVQSRYARGVMYEDEFGNVSPSQWEALPAFKLATVGDRYVADIRPIVQLVGAESCLAIRILHGKYSNETPKGNDPKPDYEVSTLTQARNLLLRSSIWDEKRPVRRPPHLGEPINAENASYILASFGEDMPKVVRFLAETIMQDNRVPASILMPCLELSKDSLLDWKNDEQARSRITALINQASLDRDMI